MGLFPLFDVMAVSSFIVFNFLLFVLGSILEKRMGLVFLFFVKINRTAFTAKEEMIITML